jgi:hypothetical protein
MLTYIRSKFSDSDSLYNKVLGEEKGWVHWELGCGHDIEESQRNSERRKVSVWLKRVENKPVVEKVPAEDQQGLFVISSMGR